MKIIRKISPYISIVLVLLMFTGSTGFTLIKHKCNICGHEDVKSSIGIVFTGSEICCHGEEGEENHSHSHDFTFNNDSCSHETEKLVSDDIVRSEAQPDIYPLASAIHQGPENLPKDSYFKPIPSDKILHKGRDLTTLHCQILA